MSPLRADVKHGRAARSVTWRGLDDYPQCRNARRSNDGVVFSRGQVVPVVKPPRAVRVRARGARHAQPADRRAVQRRLDCRMAWTPPGELVAISTTSSSRRMSAAALSGR